MMLVFVLLAGVFLFLASKIYERTWVNGLEAGISFSRDKVYAGDTIRLTEEIVNRKKFPVQEMEAGFRIPRGICFTGAENVVVSDYVYKRDIFSLRPMEAVRRSYQMTCMKRGRYQVDRITLRAWSFFHRKKYEISVPCGKELLVCPGSIDISGIRHHCDVLMGSDRSRRTLFEDPFAFNGIREYQPADPVNRINWRATARTQNLMVNTYASVRSEQYMIFLDVADERIIKEEKEVEAGIKAAASLCRRLIRDGQAAGMAVNSEPPVFFEPQRGTQHLANIEYFLTGELKGRRTADLDGLMSDFSVYCKKNRQSDQTGVMIRILISKNPDAAELIREAALSGDSRPGAFVLVAPYLDGGEEKLSVRTIT